MIALNDTRNWQVSMEDPAKIVEGVDDIVQSIQTELSTRFTDIRFTSICNILSVGTFINLIKYKQQNDHIKDQHREQMQTPEEWNTTHKSH